MNKSEMTRRGFDAPIDDRYFEDYEVGVTYEFDEAESLSEAEIIEFGEAYDPQYFHVDPVAAIEGPFGGLVASGWQTTALMMRLFAHHYLTSVASLGGHAADEMRWFRPVRPDDRLRLRVTVVEANPSRSKPDRGVLISRVELIDDADRPVFSGNVLNFIGRRDIAEVPAPVGAAK
jgi:acyl dehydratase